VLSSPLTAALTRVVADPSSLHGFPAKAEGVPHWLKTVALPHAIRIVVILVVAVVVRYLLVRAIDRVIHRTVESRLADKLGESRATRVLASATGALSERRRQRTETLGSVLRSVITGVVFGIAVLMVLADLGLQLGPVLASAGVVGVALGFGAQNLVKDFLSGIFMLLEDQYGVGDLVDVGEATGTVEEVTLRITKLRDPSGVAWYVRNGEITRVANKSQGWSTGVIDLPIAYSENVDRALRIIRDVVAAVYADEKWDGVLLEEPTVAGVEQITGTTVTLRVFAKTVPNQQWGVQREIRERVKEAFDAAGVRAPVVFPPVPGGPSTGATGTTGGGTISGTV
jgi:small conductance mechanosensitive channel